MFGGGFLLSVAFLSFWSGGYRHIWGCSSSQMFDAVRRSFSPFSQSHPCPTSSSPFSPNPPSNPPNPSISFF
ncbi:hypothetical protein BJ138DRAFT_1146206 [Hygrophoropsis aurantiaca]|uniref:Uncharacterized protein n=1 Tax=Hygrophoropsis aurantiaca TaxID=72124 RepID=A0ACB8AL11_9AGAM|nr:hypothetical protein BJ138DRAFT_1146206 [Hygrophoropsis aurantiaca]